MGPRVFVGNLARDTIQSDIEKLFKKYDTYVEVTMKNGFAFVEFEDTRDAEDAIKDLDGEDVLGNRIRVEMSLGTRGLGGTKPRDGGRYGDRYGPPPRSGRYGPPIRTDYRIIVENISSRTSWQ